MIRELTQRETKIAIVCGLTIAIYVGYFGVFIPYAKKIATVDAQLIAQKRKLLKHIRLLKNSGEIQRQYDYYSQLLKQPGAKEHIMAIMISDIEKVGASVDVHISRIKPKDVESGELLNRFSVDVSLNGSFKDTTRFLYILQKKPNMFEVQDIQISKKSRKTSSKMKTRLVLSKILRN